LFTTRRTWFGPHTPLLVILGSQDLDLALQVGWTPSHLCTMPFTLPSSRLPPPPVGWLVWFAFPLVGLTPWTPSHPTFAFPPLPLDSLFGCGWFTPFPHPLDLCIYTLWFGLFPLWVWLVGLYPCLGSLVLVGPLLDLPVWDLAWTLPLTLDTLPLPLGLDIPVCAPCVAAFGLLLYCPLVGHPPWVPFPCTPWVGFLLTPFRTGTIGTLGFPPPTFAPLLQQFSPLGWTFIQFVVLGSAQFPHTLVPAPHTFPVGHGAQFWVPTPLGWLVTWLQFGWLPYTGLPLVPTPPCPHIHLPLDYPTSLAPPSPLGCPTLPPWFGCPLPFALSPHSLPWTAPYSITPLYLPWLDLAHIYLPWVGLPLTLCPRFISPLDIAPWTPWHTFADTPWFGLAPWVPHLFPFGWFLVYLLCLGLDLGSRTCPCLWFFPLPFSSLPGLLGLTLPWLVTCLCICPGPWDYLVLDICPPWDTYMDRTFPHRLCPIWDMPAHTLPRFGPPTDCGPCPWVWTLLGCPFGLVWDPHTPWTAPCIHYTLPSHPPTLPFGLVVWFQVTHICTFIPG